MMKTRDRLTGVLLIDKPVGPTSNDVVVLARRALGVRRVGHTGTLDPFASGLLILCVGRATRLVEYFHMLTKRYRAVALLGVRTDTDDREGVEVARSESWRNVTPERLAGQVARLRGERMQRPPDYSARKIGGQRAYERARRGESPSLASTPVQIHSLDVVDFRPPEVEFDCEVSTGTYVRALARDLGEGLGCHAHLSSLRRTAIGGFEVDTALDPAHLLEGALPSPGWLSPAKAVAWLPGRELSASELSRVTHGQSVPWGALEPRTEGPVALLSVGRLVAVARGGTEGLHPEKVFPFGEDGP